MTYDPITQDPARDKNQPAGMEPMSINSHTSDMLGVLYTPGGAGPHPTVILLHGFPGYERNFDLAQIFRRAGWSTLVFHYRGAWGREGAFRFSNVLADVGAARDYLTRKAADFRIDSERIVLVGHSMGGWAALMNAAVDHRFPAAASIAGLNLGIWGDLVDDDQVTRDFTRNYLESSLQPLAGVTADALLNEAVINRDGWNLLNHVKALADRNLLLVAAEHDSDVVPPMHHTPLVKALESAGAAHLTHTVLESDHSFADKRLALARTVLDWLDGVF